jgi:long-chain acyl-CoA synthetase
MAPVRRQIAPEVWLLVCGGARLEPRTAFALEGLGFEVLSGYGLAETASIFTANFPRAKRHASAGKTFAPGCEIRIALAASADGAGEIQLRGPCVFQGYRDNEEANAAAFTRDGWFRTGDLGRLDDDGFLHVTGRAKELIVLAGGKNVYPEEVEKTLSAHEMVAEAAVLEEDDRLVALVRPDAEALRRAGAHRVDDAMRVALAAQAQLLPAYARAAGFAVTQQPLPRTRLGKLRRFQLGELYRQARSGQARRQAQPLGDADREFLARPVVGEVWALLGNRFPDRPLDLDASPALDLGIDSFAWMELTVEMQERFGITLDEDAIARIETVRDLLVAAEEAAREDAGADTGAGAGDVQPAEAERWWAPQGLGMRALGVVLFGVVWLLMRGAFRLRTTGRERLPDGGAFVLAPNHASDLDPLALGAALPLGRLRRTYWAADTVRLFANPVTRRICQAAQVFPVDERKPAASLRLANAVLARGLAQVWFPEAWRTPDGRLQRYLPGIGRLLAQSGAPAVPVYIAGTFAAMPRDRRWPRLKPLRVVFGSPVDAEALAAEGKGDTHDARIADGLRRRTEQLARDAGFEA